MWCCLTQPRETAVSEQDIPLQAWTDTSRSPSQLEGPRLQQEFQSCLVAGERDQSLDLSHLSPRETASIAATLLPQEARAVVRLVLPDGCSAASVRRCLDGLPRLSDITASHIQEDAQTLSAYGARRLKYFRTEPPGPPSLLLPAGAAAAVPRRLHIPDRMDLLTDWAGGAAPIPRLSKPDWSATRTYVLPRLDDESIGRHRRGAHFSPEQMATMRALLLAAPQELMSGASADNYRVLLSRLHQAQQTRASIGHPEYELFLRPLLEAALQVVSRIGPGGVLALKSPEELRSLAILRLWERSGPTPGEADARADAASAWHEYMRLDAISARALAQRKSAGLELPALPIRLY